MEILGNGFVLALPLPLLAGAADKSVEAEGGSNVLFDLYYLSFVFISWLCAN